MRGSWRAFLELLWPSRFDPTAGQKRRIAFLQAGIALIIVLAAGPEIFAAMEMTALLEALGATLFLTGFAAGAKVAALGAWSAMCRIVLPAPQLAVVRSDASTPAKALALAYVASHATWCVVHVLIVGAWAQWIVQLAL